MKNQGNVRFEDVTNTKLIDVWCDGECGYIKVKGDRVFKVRVYE